MKKKKQSKQTSVFKTILLGSNIFFAFALILSFIAGYVSPAAVWVLSYFGIVFSFLLYINVIYFFGYALMLKWYAVISLIALAVNYNNINSLFAFKAADPETENTVKIMTYNVHLFTHQGDMNNEISEFIDFEKPDIICFQEYLESFNPEFSFENYISTTMKMGYHTKILKTNRYYYGNVIFSRHKIVHQGSIVYENNTVNPTTYADIVINNDTVRVYSFHLHSFRLDETDAEAYRHPQNDGGKAMYKVLRKFKNAYKKRAPQAQALAAHIAQSPYPVIVCGDMNDTPASYAYHKISKNLDDAFIEKGFGLGTTYNGVFPSFRIDYILHSKNIRPIKFTTVHENFSDHYPVIAVFKAN